MSLLITPADSAYSKCVRERAEWTCERCGTYYPEGKRMGLHCSHFMSRGNWSTRFHPMNAFAHCYGCHQYLSSRPTLFSDWVVERLGITTVDGLIRLSHEPARGLRRRVKEIGTWYRAQHKAQQADRANGATGRIEFDACPILPDFPVVNFRTAMGDDA